MTPTNTTNPLNPTQPASAVPFDYLVYIGRFEPLHNGHFAMLRQALAQARTVIVVLGSAGGARTVKNPFTADERRQMIEGAVAAWDAARVADLRFVVVRDYYESARWTAAVRAVAGAVIDAPAHGTPRVGLFGHFKDASSGYLNDFPGWELVPQPSFGQLNAADVRRQWFEQQGACKGWRACCRSRWPRSCASSPGAKRSRPCWPSTASCRTTAAAGRPRRIRRSS
ncbi:adenylyltransferase/cytidyltransferase family protein [Cupriavidus sp. D39]|uniref:adenylyltransferase/cytidyltransferase family protein n=1 Tax=Cupriavidus sp. D39 TaxID=2997877 RepID=UPI002D1E48A3|nr:adenylyltransferase/cytidyltransferase family protein [Cupriavidus sp. D39]